jgi:hypothetical protein
MHSRSFLLVVVLKGGTFVTTVACEQSLGGALMVGGKIRTYVCRYCISTSENFNAHTVLRTAWSSFRQTGPQVLYVIEKR